MSKHRGVTEQFVDHIWLWGVKGLTLVPHVLSTVDDFEGKAVKELSLSQETSHGLESPASLASQVFWDVVKLRNVIFFEIYVFFELINGPVEFLASICFEHLL
jgi:hypothetical protein